MKIGVPVKCQNGHKAIFYYGLDGLDFRPIGVHNSQQCKCPKHDFGEGWARDYSRAVKVEDFDLFKISCCYFPKTNEVDMTIEDDCGEHVGFTFPIDEKTGNRIAEIIGPCVYHKAKINE